MHKVMIVDDNMTNLIMAKKALEEQEQHKMYHAQRYIREQKRFHLDLLVLVVLLLKMIQRSSINLFTIHYHLFPAQPALRARGLCSRIPHRSA